jgi:hypothetical protein
MAFYRWITFADFKEVFAEFDWIINFKITRYHWILIPVVSLTLDHVVKEVIPS